MQTSASGIRRLVAAGVGSLLVWLVGLGGAAAPPPPSAYVVEDAGLDIPQFIGVTVPAINFQGRIAATGPAFDLLGAPVRGPGTLGLPPFQAHRTDAALTVQQNLGDLGGDNSNGLGINDAAVVVGVSQNEAFANRAFRFTDGLGMQDLGTLGGGYSLARKINSAGEIAGESETGSDPIHAFRFVPGGMPQMQDLGTLPGGFNSFGWSINEAGTVVGDSDTPDIETESFERHAFLREKGQPMQDLGTLPGSDYSAARDINNDTPPIVVGEGEPPPSAPLGVLGGTPPRRAMRSKAGAMISLGVLPGHVTSSAWAVNDSGLVVGYSGSTTSYTSYRAFIWSDVNDSNTSNPGEMVDLNTRIPMGSGWTLLEATDINASGQITGIGLRAGVLRVFRLTPESSEPPSLTNCSVAPPSRNAAGGPFTLSVEATDDLGLASVIAEVTQPDESIINVPLAQVGMTNTYSGVFNAPANAGVAPQNYSVIFRATDSDDNTTSLSCTGFVVNPNQAPAVLSCGVTPPTRPSAGGQFTVTAHITDDIGVTSVTAAVHGPNAIPTVILTLQTGSATDGTYSGTFEAPANGTPEPELYQVQLSALDAQESSATADCGTVSVDANGSPVIVNCSVTPPTRPAAGGQFTVTAEVTDDIGVTSVTAVVNGPNVIPNVILTLQSGTATNGTYSGTFIAPANATPAPELYQVQLSAFDGGGASTTTDCGTVSVLAPLEAVPPTITECSTSPEFLPRQGGVITIGARVTDNVGVTAVYAVITQPDASEVIVPLAHQGGDQYQGTFNVPANPQEQGAFYTVRIEAEDAAGNTATDFCGEVHRTRVAGRSELPPGGIGVSPKRLDFGKVKVGKKVRLKVKIKHNSTVPGSLLLFRLGTLRAPFRIVAGASARGTSNGLIPLGPGAEHIVTVEFAPTAIGCFEDDLIVESSDPSRPTVLVHCIGKGCKVRN